MSDSFESRFRDTEKLRAHFARLVVATAGVTDPRIEAAFASVRREDFAGEGPWSIAAGAGYVETPDDDPAYLYQNCLIAIDARRRVNIGQPTLHANRIEALAVQPGDTVVHVGAGVGYYTAILAELVGPTGKVFGYEIEPAYAERARRNLAKYPHVEIIASSGVRPDLPKADIVYVNAAALEPHEEWLDALKVGGRLMFPLQEQGAGGAMLLLTRPAGDESKVWPAEMWGPVWFIPLEESADGAVSGRLAAAFRAGGFDQVRSLRFDSDSAACWYAGDGWRLSTAAP